MNPNVEYRNLVFWEDDNNTCVEHILQYFLSESVEDDNTIVNLSEDMKFFQFSKVFRRILDSIRNKANLVDFRDIDRSKGDLTRVDGYGTFDRALKQLRQVNSRKDSILQEIVELHDNILRFKTPFKESYAEDSFTGISLYRSSVFTFFYGVSMYLATFVTVKVPQGGSKPMIIVDGREEINKNFAFQSVRKYNKIYRDGKVQQFFKNGDISKDDGESFIKSIRDSKTLPNTRSSISGQSILVGGMIVVGLSIAIFTIINLIRETLFYFYKFRKYLDREFSIAAEYLELNAELVDDKAVRARQLKIAERYRKIAESIRVKSDMTTKQVEKEIKRELVLDQKQTESINSIARESKPETNEVEVSTSNNRPSTILI